MYAHKKAVAIIAECLWYFMSNGKITTNINVAKCNSIWAEQETMATHLFHPEITERLFPDNDLKTTYSCSSIIWFFYHICWVDSFNHSLYFLNVSLLGILWKKGKIHGLFFTFDRKAHILVLILFPLGMPKLLCNEKLEKDNFI